MLGTLRLMPLDEVAPDTTLLQFLDLTAPNRRVAALPRKLRERLFRRGVPGLGWTTASWILGAALLASVAAGFFLGLPPDTGVRVVIAGRCVDSKGIPVRPTLVHLSAKLAETPSFTWSPGDGGFQLRAHTAKHGALTVSFQGPKGTTVTRNASGALPFWNIVFPEPATPNQPDESANLLVNQAIAAYNRGDYAYAVQIYKMALALDPNNGRALDLMAYSLFKLKQYDQAVSELQRAIGLGYDYALLDLARVECARGNYPAAKLDLQNVKITSLRATALKDGELLRLCSAIVSVLQGVPPPELPGPASGELLNANPAQSRPTVEIFAADRSNSKAELVREAVSKAGYRVISMGSDYLPVPSGVFYSDPAYLQYAQEIAKLVAAVLARAIPVQRFNPKLEQFDPKLPNNVILVWMLGEGAAPAVAAEAWELIKDSKDAADFDAFARTFPSSDLAGVARLRADQLRRAAPAQTAQVPTLPAATSLSELQDAYFDYDKSDIRPDARAALNQDAAILKKVCAQARASVIIEGHADANGTAEDQLALGDRRAAAVKDFLVQLGVPADCLREISYGKERPVCTDPTEACFQRNRRVHFSPGQ